jgi:hypothetical protein
MVADNGYRIVKENSPTEEYSSLWNSLELVRNGAFDSEGTTTSSLDWKIDRISV